MIIHHFGFRVSRKARTAAFSLVEVALSLGLVGFALVGIIGAIPLAADSSRQSIAQTRAASLANTIFTNFRAQPFGAVQYIDVPTAVASPTANVMITTTPINLNTLVTLDKDDGGKAADGPKVVFYASFDEVPTDVPSNDERRVHFTSDKPKNGPSYLIVLRFNNNPAGTLAPYKPSPTGDTKAEANSIDASICDANIDPVKHPKDVYHFNSIISSRLE